RRALAGRVGVAVDPPAPEGEVGEVRGETCPAASLRDAAGNDEGDDPLRAPLLLRPSLRLARDDQPSSLAGERPGDAPAHLCDQAVSIVVTVLARLHRVQESHADRPRPDAEAPLGHETRRVEYGRGHDAALRLHRYHERPLLEGAKLTRRAAR